MIRFILGLIAGGNIGILAMCIFQTAGAADKAAICANKE